MKGIRLLMVQWVVCLVYTHSFSQCPITNTITAPASACLTQNFEVSTQVNAGYTYEWDFCAGDFTQPTTFVNQYAGGLIKTPFHFELVHDGNYYRGFIANGTGKNVLRFDFNGGLNQPPLVSSINLINAPAFVDIRSLRLIQDGSNWYGIMTDLFQAKLFRLSFGTSLQNNPTVETFDVPSLNLALDLTILKEGADYYVLILNYGQNYISKIRFPSSMSAAPEFLPSVTIPGSNAVSLSVKKVCSSWVAFAAMFGSSGICRIDLGTSLASPAVGTKMYFTYTGVRGISLEEEADGYYVFATTSDGKLYRLDFGVDPLSDPIAVSSPVSLLTGTTTAWDIEMLRDNSGWHFYFMDYQKAEINHFTFDNPCTSSIANSTLSSAEINYSTPGQKKIFLKVRDDNGAVKILSSDITITSNMAPVSAFSQSDVECINTAIVFDAEVDPAITNYSWIYGDTNFDTGQQVTHSYLTSGNYLVELEVTSSNGCTNRNSKEISIYNSPAANFDLPSNNPICSNQLLSFINTSTSDLGSNPNWDWKINGNTITQQLDLQYTFTTTDPVSVQLIASIPGCFDELTQIINTIAAGPIVNFNAANGCAGTPVDFENLTSGSVLTYQWQFGDAQVSSDTNPSHTYSNSGAYHTELVAISANGCQNSFGRDVVIYTLPQPDFSIDLPPFSCSGTPSQFNDLTSNPTDSNLTGWSWNFGDLAAGTSAQRHPTYVYANAGPYTVSLQVTTNYGCAATTQKTVQISSSPLSDFTFGSTCLNQSTTFTSLVDPNIQSWLWKIGSTTYAMANPTHVFGSTGNVNVQLTTVGTNNCVAIQFKTITVPVPPTLNFSMENNCSGQQTMFKDTTPSGLDNATAWLWDFAGKGNSTTSPAQFLFADPGVYAVKMTTTHASGCSYSLTKNSTINLSPTASFKAQPENGPPPLVVQFTNQSTNAATFGWKFNDANNSQSALPSPSFTYTTLGDYQVELTATSILGCADVSTRTVHVILPYTDVGVEGVSVFKDDLTGESRPVITIRNNSNFKVTELDVLVDISGGGVIKEHVTTLLAPETSGVIVLSAGIIPRGNETYLCAELKLLGDENPANDKDCLSLDNKDVILSPYPNPAHGELRMDWIAETEGSLQFTIFNSTGQVAFHQEMTGIRKGLNQLWIDISRLSPGMYLILFDDGRSRKSFTQMVN